MVKQRSLIRLGAATLALLAVVLVLGSGVRAAKDLVVDQAGVFTSDQARLLEEAAAALSEKHALDLVIVTTNDTGGRSSMEYADDFFDYNGYGVGADFDGVLMLIDFQNRMVWISTSGRAIDILTDRRIEGILDAMEAGMIASDYYRASQAFLDATANYLRGNSLTLVESILSLLASAGIGAGVIGNVRSRYKGKAGRPVFLYQNNSLVDMGVVADNLTRTYTTSRVIPRPPPSAGGGGGSTRHTSGSGRTHGGGGRRF